MADFKKFMVMEDGLPLLFLGLDKKIYTQFAVNVPTAPGPDMIDIYDVDDRASYESSSARIQLQRDLPGNPSDLSVSSKRRKTERDARAVAKLKSFSIRPLNLEDVIENRDDVE